MYHLTILSSSDKTIDQILLEVNLKSIIGNFKENNFFNNKTNKSRLIWSFIYQPAVLNLMRRKIIITVSVCPEIPLRSSIVLFKICSKKSEIYESF